MGAMVEGSDKVLLARNPRNRRKHNSSLYCAAERCGCSCLAVGFELSHIQKAPRVRSDAFGEVLKRRVEMIVQRGSFLLHNLQERGNHRLESRGYLLERLFLPALNFENWNVMARSKDHLAPLIVGGVQSSIGATSAARLP